LSGDLACTSVYSRLSKRETERKGPYYSKRSSGSLTLSKTLLIFRMFILRQQLCCSLWTVNTISRRMDKMRVGNVCSTLVQNLPLLMNLEPSEPDPDNRARGYSTLLHCTVHTGTHSFRYLGTVDAKRSRP
jgi:hypothetical protein